MRKRTHARGLALQALYQYDLHTKTGSAKPEDFDEFVRSSTDDPEVRRYARVLIDGAIALLPDLDARIAAVAQNWKIQRMAPVDRCILRVALFEILESSEVPPRVAINEAIELAKRYSTEQSGAFVNGILDKIYRELIEESGK